MFTQLTCVKCGKSFFVGEHRKIIVSICDDCLQIEEYHKNNEEVNKWKISEDGLKEMLKVEN